MAKSMLEALKEAKLVDERKAAALEEQNRQEDVAAERRSGLRSLMASERDLVAENRQERYLATASRETTKAGSRVGTRAYFDRFRR